MKKYFLISTILVMLVGCTANDSFFGNDMLPPSQDMYTSIDSSMTLQTYTITLDSVPSTTKDGGLVGSTLNPFTGRTDMGFMATYTPATTDDNRYFGKELAVDSLAMHLRFDLSLIDNKNPIEISIYELENIHLKYNKMYYSNFDPTPYYNESKPLAKFIYLKDPYATIDSMRIKLPREFLEKLVKPEYLIASPSSPYYSDTNFIKTFNGLYFKATPASSRGNAVSIPTIGAYMNLYYRQNTSAAKPDTLLRRFLFYSSTSAPYNTTVTVASHDYSLANPSQGGVEISQINDTINQTQNCYLQGLGGLGARVILDTSHIRKMNNAAIAKGYKSVAIHKAEIRWFVPQINMTYYNDIINRLGLFSWDKGKMGYIPDYDPVTEINTNNPTSFGILLRSNGYYSMDVTSSVQRLFSGKGTVREFNMSIEYKQLLDPYRSVVGGSLNTQGVKPLIILTYTLIK